MKSAFSALKNKFKDFPGKYGFEQTMQNLQLHQICIKHNATVTLKEISCTEPLKTKYYSENYCFSCAVGAKILCFSVIYTKN